MSTFALLSVVATVLIGAGASAAAPGSARRPDRGPAVRSDELTSAELAAGDLVTQRATLGDRAADLAAARAEADRRRRSEADLTALLTGYDGTGYVDLSVTVIDRKTGQRFDYADGRQFETASVVKVDILATLLLQAQRAGRTLSAREKSLAVAMIEHSDNDAASQLWTRTHGISTAVKTFGLTGTDPDGDGDWGLTETTAADQARLVTGLADPDGPVTDADYLFDLMGNVDPDQDWGISAAARSGEVVAIKNGWLSRDTQNGRWTVNSIGRITDADTDVSIVVLSRGHVSFAAGTDMVAAVARATRTYLGW
ncbi:MAG: hypothetical protein QOE03_437 [Micromonosporaceae bacterium]|nr:hypothetical protein [Micromonosporaceae bacterium]